MRISKRILGAFAILVLCAASAQEASAQTRYGTGAGPNVTPGGRTGGRGGGGGGGPNWGGVGAGVAAGVIGGLILQGIANANANPGRSIDDGAPRPRAPRNRAASSGRGSGVPPAGETRFVPDEVVAQIPNAMPAQRLSGVERRHRLSRLESQRSQLGGATLVRWRITDRRSVPAVIRALESEGVVASAQPNYVFSLQQAAQSESPPQYAIAKMNIPDAHRLARGDGVLVAVIDSGIDASHPELQGAIADSFNAAASAPDTHAHGTGIAGLIAARTRFVGTAPGARILAVRAFDPKDAAAEATTFAILKGLDWSVEKGARVINMSFAGPADPAIARSLAAALRRGAVLIAAAGNAGEKSAPLYPAADPNVIAVTATGPDDTLFAASNRGRHIAVAAPGVDIVAPSVEAGYQVASGTSMAAAEVSGVVALLLERRPKLSPGAVRTILLSTARDLGKPGRDDQFGAGLTDAYQALMALEPKTAGTVPAATR